MLKRISVVAGYQVLDRVINTLITAILLLLGSKVYYAEWITVTISTSLIVSVAITPFTNLVITRFAQWTNSEKQAIYQGVFRVMLLLAAPTLILVYCLRETISRIVFPFNPDLNLVMVLFLFAFSELLFEILIALQRAAQEYSKASIIMIARTITKIVVIALLQILNIYETKMAVIVISAIQFIIGKCILRSSAPQNIDSLQAKFNFGKLLGFTRNNLNQIIIFAVINLSYGLNSTIDRYFINNRIGQDELGVYSIHFTLVSVITLLYIAINFINFPQYSTNYHLKNINQDLILKKNISIFLKGSIFAVGIFEIWGRLVILVISNGAFKYDSELMLLISFSSIFLGINILCTSALLVKKRLKTVVLVLMSAAILNIVCNYFLTETSLKGAAISSLISNAYLALISIYLMDKKILYIYANIFDLQFLRICVYLIILSVSLNQFRLIEINDIIVNIIATLVYLPLIIYELSLVTKNKGIVNE